MKAKNNNDKTTFSRRQEILKTAASLFLRKGFMKTSVRDIARESGIVVGTLYHYIKTKDDIVWSIMEEEQAFARGFVKAVEQDLLKMGPVEALRKSMHRYYRMIDDTQDLNIFWLTEGKNMLPDQRKILLECELQFVQAFQKILVTGCKSGDFHIQDTLLTANDIVVMGDMWAHRRWFLGKHCAFEEYFDRQSNLIMSGIYNGTKAGPSAQINKTGKGRKRR
jgi:TetR/AcrR family transcriptional regulator, cholesterol catabolism regulator